MEELRVAPLGKRFLSMFIDFFLIVFVTLTLFYYPIQEMYGRIFNVSETRQEYNELMYKYGLLTFNEDGEYIYTEDGRDENSLAYQTFLEDPRVKEIHSQEDTLVFLEMGTSLIISVTIFELIIPIFTKYGVTIGKKLNGLIVVDDNFIRIKKGSLILRFLSCLFIEGIISLFTYGIPLVLDLILFFFTKEHWTIHDFLGQSKVILKTTTHFDNIASRVEYDELNLKEENYDQQNQ